MSIKICISSCKGYSDKTIPLLVDSLLNSSVNAKDIYVFEGGHSVDKKLDKNYNHFLVSHNSFDFTSLIEITENNFESNFWLLLHDTCKVGNKFLTKLSEIKLDREKYSLIPYPSMNIGIYSQSYLQQHRHILGHLKNKDYSQDGIKRAKKRAIYNEDILLYQVNDVPCQLLGTERIVLNTNVNWYGMPTPRTELYYPQLDLYKLGANSNWEDLVCTL